ncbi:hypothetical protein V6N13_137223 [Hibiscus sabdariffa]|uniref:Uncharacterized protein n=1 Tax=Hibiscus sabdariffa TaxID=183260 RepID=A0ABR2DL89_9ROSI
MNEKENICFDINQEEFEETLSFYDLSVEYQDFDDQFLAFHHSSDSLPHDRDRFEFPFISNTRLKNNETNDIVFCGKLIKEQEFVVDNRDQGKHFSSSHSAKQFNKEKKDLGSLYLVNSKSKSSLLTKSFRFQNSSSVKQYRSLIGITKIQLKMELSDLKKRQSKQDYPLPMFPPSTTNVDNIDGCSVSDKRCFVWNLLRPTRYRAHTFSGMNKT